MIKKLVKKQHTRAMIPYYPIWKKHKIICATIFYYTIWTRCIKLINL